MKNKEKSTKGRSTSGRKNAALFSPYLDILGGGEKYSLAIMKALEEQGYEISLFWKENIQSEITKRLSLRFSHISFLPDLRSMNFLEKSKILKNFDILLYVTNGSYFFSSAKKNFVYAMVPQQNLYRKIPFNWIKLLNYEFITHSQFTSRHLNLWGIQSHLLYPYLDEKFLNVDETGLKKESIILSVGRFFSHLHSKRQDLMIKTFREMKKNNPLWKNYKLYLAGGLKKEDERYFRTLQKLCADDTSIQLLPNISYQKLLEVYKKAQVYWHFAGFGIDENKQPHLVEHFGITSIEAMSMGCIAFCYNAGGPKEIIQDGKNGFLFTTIKELERKMDTIFNNKNRLHNIRQEAKKYVTEHFNNKVFSNSVKRIFIDGK